ncbi:FAD binding domain-containing protein [Rhodoplanes sp. Z2-YC6860]|uniref:FAD binding domain-containing protein n=1 Tax=Rhodoplanes sp. Z2-YC6860 TaxID=674703 RepID=UPI00078CE700|nr:FAD binding domain-containing protein [Rhodoplanes sp. Z2-YC6860]AMN41186.1 aerobic-type carbon monoxide dehydrogenase, middle subunit CoxM/CutM-like protein [Rhodoplanes sp. Z2-YC6860]
MKARGFRYVKPSTLKNALQILHDAGADAVPLAGGQSLLAGLNLRLSAPSLLVDISGLTELSGRTEQADSIRIGAATRHAELLRCPLIQKHLPLLTKAAPHIAHAAIRNRGTIGGSLAYSDPSAELPACAIALDAALVLASVTGEREVKAEQFFKGLFETDLRPGELIVAVKFPKVSADTKCLFLELARRHGDFAMIGIAARIAMDGPKIANARVVYFGAVEHAKLARLTSAALTGLTAPIGDFSALHNAIQDDVVAQESPGLRSDTVRHLAEVLTRRAMGEIASEVAA